MSDKLLNCPFCKKATSAGARRHHDGMKRWHIDCVNLACDFIVESKGGYPTRGMAEETWSTQSKPIFTQEDVERAARAMSGGDADNTTLQYSRYRMLAKAAFEAVGGEIG